MDMRTKIVYGLLCTMFLLIGLKFGGAIGVSWFWIIALGAMALGLSFLGAFVDAFLGEIERDNEHKED
jgi:hypothetical protein